MASATEQMIDAMRLSQSRQQDAFNDLLSRQMAAPLGGLLGQSGFDPHTQRNALTQQSLAQAYDSLRHDPRASPAEYAREAQVRLLEEQRQRYEHEKYLEAARMDNHIMGVKRTISKMTPKPVTVTPITESDDVRQWLQDNTDNWLKGVEDP